jgi:hypothetical protein
MSIFIIWLLKYPSTCETFFTAFAVLWKELLSGLKRLWHYRSPSVVPRPFMISSKEIAKALLRNEQKYHLKKYSSHHCPP